jgi:hypothetical protein
MRAAILRLAAVSLILASAPLAMAQQWAPTGDLNFARAGASATLLPNGDVLIAGGAAASGSGGNVRTYIAQAELFDPSTGAFHLTGSLNYPRSAHAALLLPNGKVLIVGGGGQTSEPPPELYDPGTGAFSALPQLPVSLSGGWRTSATLLNDGRVMITGDTNVVFYNPTAGSYTVGPTMLAAGQYTQLLLPSGDVLVAGGTLADGQSPAPSQIYHVATNQWQTLSGAPQADIPILALLPSGKVLDAGGSSCCVNVGQNAYIFDPATLTFTQIEYTLHWLANNVGGDAPVLPSGHVLLNDPQWPELYDPATGAFSEAGWTTFGSAWAQLADGSVLAAGGTQPVSPSSYVTVATAQVFHENVTEYTLNGPGLLPKITASSGSFTIGSVPVSGYSGSIQLSCVGEVYPSGCTISPNPISAGQSATLSYDNVVCDGHLDVLSSTPDFNYWMAIYPQGSETGLTPSPASATVSAGTPALYTVAIPTCTSARIALSCSNLPQYAACYFTPASPAINPAPLTTVVLGIETAPGAAAIKGMGRDAEPDLPPIFLFALAFAALLVTCIAAIQSHRLAPLSLMGEGGEPAMPARRSVATAAGLLSAVIAGVLATSLIASACGSHATTPAPAPPQFNPCANGCVAPGTYSITLTGTYNDFPRNNTVTVTAPVTLVVK